MGPVKKIKCEENVKVGKVKEKSTYARSKEHNFQINQVKQVQKKVNHASKSLVRVEHKEDHIKVKPNSGCFKVLSERVK